jgi:glycosyltransferase involved in cell wall biosynthesis
MDKHQVAIIIPAFNEENTIFDVVQSVRRYGVVIVINDA